MAGAHRSRCCARNAALFSGAGRGTGRTRGHRERPREAMNSRAVVMRRTGGPEVLSVEDLAFAPLRDGEVRLRALASAVNHSDLEIRAGNWTIRRNPKFPYVPGLEVVGDVVEVDSGVESARIGDRFGR